MTEFKIIKSNKPKEHQFMQYDIENSLETFLSKYDKNVNPRNTNVSIGNERFNDWEVSMEECSFYGEEVYVFTYNLTLNITYNNLMTRIVVDKRKKVTFLKSEIIKTLKMDTIPILYHNKELLSGTGESIESLNLNDGSTIEVQNGLQKTGSFFIKIITITGKSVLLTACPLDEVSDIKENVSKSIGLHSDSQRLLLSGKQIEDGFSLKDYNIEKECKFHVIPRLRNDSLSVSNLQEEKILVDLNKTAKMWRIFRKGLCLEGKCMNLE